MAQHKKRRSAPTTAIPTAAQDRSRRWKLEDAKARFSELVRMARERGPQRVTVYGKDAIVVVSAEEFDRLRSRSEAPSLYDLFANSPLKDIEFGEERLKSPVREVEL